MKSGSAIRAYNTAVNLRIEKLIKENGSSKGRLIMTLVSLALMERKAL